MLFSKALDERNTNTISNVKKSETRQLAEDWKNIKAELKKINWHKYWLNMSHLKKN